MKKVVFAFLIAIGSGWFTLASAEIGWLGDRFPVVVDYGQAIEEMVKAGGFDSVHPFINSDNFSMEKNGKVNVNIQLIHSNKPIKSGEILKVFDKMGLRPANLPELLAFAAKYPEIQKNFLVISLDKVASSSGDHQFVPHLAIQFSERLERILEIAHFDSIWSFYCLFAAVNKPVVIQKSDEKKSTFRVIMTRKQPKLKLKPKYLELKSKPIYRQLEIKSNPIY